MTPESDRDPSFLTTLSHRAMATEFVVMLPPSDAQLCDVVIEALESLDKIEAALTVYREESEISQVNRQAFDHAVGVSPETFQLLQRALRWSEQTGGAFDITAGPLVEVWGFTKRSGRKPTGDQIQAALDRVGYQHVGLDAACQSVRFAKPGMQLNLGGIGKGDALDRLSDQLTAAGIKNFLIHGGNSSVVASGNQTAGDDRGWAVGIAHPTKPTRRIGGIWLRDAALGTSGSGKQFFHHRGRRYGHVIDPRTGYPAGDLLSLTVITASAADADAAATGFFVAGSAKLEEVTHESADLSMIAVAAGGRQDEVRLSSYGEVTWVDPEESVGD